MARVRPDVEEAMRDLAVGQEILVITWLDRAPRDVLSTYPGSDPTRPARGVFSLRSPGRPNLLGVRRVPILEIDVCRVRVGGLEAVHAVVDVKAVLDRQGC